MITVSIVTYKVDLDELRLCLSCLTSPLISTIYLIDNAAEERVRNFSKNYKNIKYIPSENIGYGAAHNIALRQALDEGGIYHLVINSDISFDPHIIDTIYSFMENHDEVGQIQPKILNPDGSLQYTVRLLPTPFDVFARRFLPKFIYKSRNDRYLLKKSDHSKPFNVPYHQGSFMFLRLKAISKIGLFDERYFMYPEDIDLTRRIHSEYETLFFPDVSIIHNHRAASYFDWEMTKIHCINMIKYFNKWGWFFDRTRRRYNKKVLKSINKT